MEISRFTTRTQEAIAAAIQAATSRGNTQLEALHLLEALLGQDDTVVGPLLEAVGVQPVALQAAVTAEAGRLPAASGATVSAPTYSRGAVNALNLSQQIADSMKDEFTSVEHVLIALAETESSAQQLLTEHKITGEALRAALPGVRKGRVTSADPEATFDALEKAFDYRGDITLHLAGGRVVAGYLFDRRKGSGLADSTVRLLPADGGDAKVTVAYADIRRIEFSTRDPAAAITASTPAWAAMSAVTGIRSSSRCSAVSSSSLAAEMSAATTLAPSPIFKTSSA